MIKSVKRLGAAVLSAVMMLTAVATPLGDNLPAVRESTSLTASAAEISTDGYYTLKNLSAGKMLNVRGSYSTSNTNVTVYETDGTTGQQFRFIKSGSNYVLEPKCAPSCALNVYGTSASNGSNVNIWTKSGNSTQAWVMEYNSSSAAYVIRCAANKNLVLTATGTSNSSNVALANYSSGNKSQLWSAAKVGGSTSNSTYNPVLAIKYASEHWNDGVGKCASFVSACLNAGGCNASSALVSNLLNALTNGGYGTRYQITTSSYYAYESQNKNILSAGDPIFFYCSKCGGWQHTVICSGYDSNGRAMAYGHNNAWNNKTSGIGGFSDGSGHSGSCITVYSFHMNTHTHSYGSWYTKTSATCTSGGTEERKCSCGATESRSTSALGHNYGSTYFEADHPHKYAHLCQRCGYKEFTGGNLDYYYLCATCTHLTKPEVTKITGDLVDNSEITIEWTASESDKLANYWLDVIDPEGLYVVDVSTGKINSYTFIPVKTGTYTIKTHAAPIGNKDGSGSVGAETTIEIGCNHNYITEIVNPTYDNEGYTLHTCTKCGYSYKDNYTPALKLTELTGVKVKTHGTNSLTLAWDKNASAKGYIIEQYKGGKWTQVAKTSSNTAVTYTVNGLAADTTYTFRIKAYVISGESEIYGGYVKIAGKTRIPNVASFKGRAVSQTAVKLDWSKNDKATGYVIEQYKGGKWTALATTKNNTTLTFTVKGLAKGTAYSFRIKSFRKTGSTTEFSEYTAIKAATLLDGVSDFKVASTTGSWITLEWAKNDKATGYSIEQYKGGKWTVIATTKNNTTLKFTVKGLKNDTTYSFRIRAYKTAGGVTAYSDYVRIAGKTRIANVASFKGSAVSASAVKLDWSKNDKATGYVIEQYKGGKWTVLATTKNNTTLTFTVKGLAKGTTYSFRIKSFRKTGSTTEFSEYTAIKAATLLDGVSDFKVTSVTGSWITLEWAKNDKATGYAIEQYKGGKWTVIATTKNNTTLKFTVKGLKNDTTYSFRIRAYKTAGASNVYSDYVRIAGKTRIPNVAKFTGSAVSASAVKLDWSKNDKATGYVIEQYKGGKWTALATTKNNTTLTFTVKGLAKGTTYSFRIKSFRKTGSTTEFSEYAAIKAGTDR